MSSLESSRWHLEQARWHERRRRPWNAGGSRWHWTQWKWHLAQTPFHHIVKLTIERHMPQLMANIVAGNALLRRLRENR